MDVVLLDFDVLEPVEERAPVIQKSVHDDAGDERECGQVERRVLVVGGEVEFVVRCDDTGDVVRPAKPVVRLIGGDGEVTQVPDVRVVEGGR